MGKADDFRKEIELELGAPVLKIELTEESWLAIVNKAKRWFKARKGVKGFSTIPLVPGVCEYDFPENACDILDVILPHKGDIQSLLSLGFSDIPFNILDNGGLIGPGSAQDYSGYVQVLQSLETRRRIYSADPSWEIMCDKIMVLGNYNKNSATAGARMLVLFSKSEWEVDELRGRDEQIFYDYMRAVALHVLGRIRSKYSSYPSAGGSIDMDGADLIAEAREEYERLDEEVSESQGPMGPVYG